MCIPNRLATPLFYIITTLLLFFFPVDQLYAHSCGHVFISEYIEGSSWNKAIELYNSSPQPVDLSNYEVRIYFNGNPTAGSIISPQDSLNPGEVYVIAHTNWGLDSTAVDTFYGGLSFNGNDAIALYENAVKRDQIGEIGVDPGTDWTVGSGSTQNNTLVRADSVKGGNTNWTQGANEWEVYAQDVDSLLGWHNSDCISGPPSAGFFTSDTLTCEDDSVAFTDTSSNYVIAYTWYFEGGMPDTSTQTSPSVFYDSSGMYDVTLIVRNVNGSDTVTKSNYIQVASRNGLDLNYTMQPVACNGDSNGIVDLSVIGGTAPFSYNWSNGDSSQDLSNMPAGNYRVTLTDSNTCVDTLTATVTEPPPVVINLDSISNPACNGDSNGILSLDVTGGTMPYTYAWNTGDSTQSITGLPAGQYAVTVVDSNGCNDSSTFTLVDPPSLTITIDSALNPKCKNDSNGLIAVTALGGKTPYSYNWSNGATQADISGLPADTFILTVTDANNCQIRDTVTFFNPPQLSLSVSGQDLSCSGANDGSADLTATGGVTPYSYFWSNSAATEDINGLTAGTYTVTVTDSLGCQKQASVNIGSPAAITSNIIKQNASCAGCCDGQADLSVSGGTTPYSYSWDNGATTQDISSLCAGTYVVTITDTNNCNHIDTVVIDENTGITMNATKGHVKIYPNPVQDVLHIQLQEKKPGFRLYLYDLTGHQKRTYQLSKKKTRLNLQSLPTGVYFIEIESQENSRWHKLVVY